MRGVPLVLLVASACGARSVRIPADSDAGAPGDAGGPPGDAGYPGEDSGGPPGSCDGLGEAECLGAFPDCVPMYDDACCPSCAPEKWCADCIRMEFHSCLPFAESACTPGFVPTCGTTPGWACEGGQADCTECSETPGCVHAFHGDCEPKCDDMDCRPVTAGSCTATCRALPPDCPDGYVPEADGSCWTGYCIPARVCE